MFLKRGLDCVDKPKKSRVTRNDDLHHWFGANLEESGGLVGSHIGNKWVHGTQEELIIV